MFSHGETVTRVRAARVPSPYNPDATVADWADVETADLGPCAVYQSSTDELISVGRDATTEGVTVLAPHGVDVTDQDRLRIRGIDHDVAGFPHAYHHPMSGWEPGVQIICTRTEG